MLPLFFGLMAAASLLMTLGFLWKSLRISLGGVGAGAPEVVSMGQKRARLLDEKRAALQGMRELQEDFDAGKISEDDFNRVHRSLKGQAIRALQALDAPIAPYLDAAEALALEHLERASTAEASPEPEAAEASPALNDQSDSEPDLAHESDSDTEAEA